MGEKICPVFVDLRDVVPGTYRVTLDTFGDLQSSDIEQAQIRREFKLTSALAAAQRCNDCGINDEEDITVLDTCPMEKSIMRRATTRMLKSILIG